MARIAAPAETGHHIEVSAEPMVRMLIVDSLEDLGNGCIEASGGPSELKLIETTPEIDFLVTDVGLPGGLNGRQVAEAARALRPGLRILFVTGYAENAVLNHGHIARGMEVLTKPFAVEELGRRVTALMQQPGD